MLVAVGPSLERAARNYSVVVAKRLTVKIYGELQSFLNDQSITITRNLVTRGSMDVYTVSELDNAIEQLPFQNRCIHYKCHVCNKDVVTTLRPLAVMSVSDHTSTVKVVAIGDMTEIILQNTTSKIAGLIKKRKGNIPGTPVITFETSNESNHPQGVSTKKQLTYMPEDKNKNMDEAAANDP
ncbi:hypothetical protein LIER_07899 [Lithospermum erythrorhizon]|uniref:Uncharacterized protein n=1 Tax=Lithospermum erythrorhizon TaxID=34254 RepID=A0AAV3PB38_LITER